MTRTDAIARACRQLQSGEFLADLGRRVAYPTESQNPERRDCLRAYLEDELTPAFAQLGFSTRLIESPGGKNPYLLAQYRESSLAPTVLMYGHGDVVDGMAGEWRDKLDPWRTTRVGDRVYGRGTADNKGQHSINLSALRAVREARGGRLGFNAKFIIETGEEIWSPDLRQVCEQLRDELKADLFLASDGPRLAADRPTIFLGCRGGVRIHLDVNLRDGSHHSGNWGGVLANPATILASAIATLVDGKGRLLLDQLKPPRISNQIRATLADITSRCPMSRHYRKIGARRACRRPKGFMRGTRSKCWRCHQAMSNTRPTPYRDARRPSCNFASSSVPRSIK
jgi:acetylornithine deacetylase/succinyl-diaminopimelate desuccinylase-like protein